MNDFILILPEIFLAITLGFLVVGELTYHGEKKRLLSATALLGLSAAAIQCLLGYRYGFSTLFSGALAVDGITFFLKLLILVVAVLATIAVGYSRETVTSRRGEYLVLILSASLGLLVLCEASELLLIFLSIQLVNISCCFLAGYDTSSERSNEASIKFLIFSCVAATLFLFAAALLFSFSGSLNLGEIHKFLVVHAMPGRTGIIVFALFFLSLAFQMGVFPFYLWAPDVIEGAPTAASGFLMIAPRLGGFIIAMRTFLALFSERTAIAGHWQILGETDWTTFVAVSAGATMLIGSLLALRQQSAKRLMAALAVAQSGHLLLGLLVQDEVGLSALLYAWMVDIFALIGIFTVLGYYFDQIGSDRLDDLSGVLRKTVPEGAALIFFLCCFIGIPPAPGFIAKFGLIESAFSHHRAALGMVSILATAISVAAAGQLIFGLLGGFVAGEEKPSQPNPALRIFLGGITVPLVVIAVFSQTILDWAGRSLSAILW